MKTKFYFIFLLSLLGIGITSYAQEQRFIEVVSVDTVMIKPVSYVYQISLGQQYEFMGIKIPQNNEEEDVLIPSVTEIENILKKGNFNYTLSDGVNYALSGSDKISSISVELANEKELIRLFELLEDKEGITGKVEVNSYEPISMYYEKIYTKLYNDALIQAQTLAKVTNSNVGNLISVSELKNEYDGLMSMYKDAMKDMPFGFFKDTGTLLKKVEKKFSFKFELK